MEDRILNLGPRKAYHDVPTNRPFGLTNQTLAGGKALPCIVCGFIAAIVSLSLSGRSVRSARVASSLLA